MAKIKTKRLFKEYPTSITVKPVTEPIVKSINSYISLLCVAEGRELRWSEACLEALKVGLDSENKRLLSIVETRKNG
jgi:hypothetical protein